MLITFICFISCKNYNFYDIPKGTIKVYKVNGNKDISLDDIKTNILGLRESNTQFIDLKLSSYLANKRKQKDSLQIKNASLQFFKRSPKRFDLNEITNTTKSLIDFYRKNGFLHTSVAVQIDSSNQKAIRIGVNITENLPSRITKKDSVVVDNPTLEKNVQAFLNTESQLKRNDILSFESLDAEKKALSSYLRNRGYYYFNPDLVGLRINDIIDTSLYNIHLLYKIPDFNYQYTNRQYDRLFRIGSIIFNESSVENTADESTWIRKSISSNQIKRILSLKEGDLFSANKIAQSLQNIYATDQFKSVSINYDTSASRILPRIDLIKNDKYNISSEIGGSVFRGIPGPFLTNSLKIRRVFTYLDFVEITNRIGFEAQTGFINTADTRKNLELNLYATANFPSLYIPKLFNHLFENSIASSTQIGLGFDYINRPEYLRTNARLFQKYLWRKSNNEYFQLSFVDINVLNTDYPQTSTSDAFKVYLDEIKLRGNNLYRSFNPSFVSSINFNYNYRTFNLSNKLVAGKSILFGLESGGTTLNLLKEKRIKFIENVLGNNQDIQFYRYLRFNIDYRNYWLVGQRRNSQIAFKLLTGVAYAYGNENVFQLPYEKNFFIGGPSSIRAWKPRRLGPGSYNALTNLIEQPGSILLESSIEYRFPLFQFLGTMNGALFIDAGNIWNIKYGDNVVQGSFAVNNFIDEIAVGTGFGLRWDFDYFLLRLDLATKLRNPANPINEKWVLSKATLSNGENPIEFNIGIGYPF